MIHKKQLSFFNPVEVNDIDIHVVGVGAVGSYVAMNLATAGLTKNLTLWDADKVESGNLGNQIFFERHIGKNKVEAIVDLIEEKGIEEKPVCKVQEVTAKEAKELRGIVVICVDTFAARKEIFENLSQNVTLVLEARLGTNVAQYHVVNPRSLAQREKYVPTIGSDDHSVTSECGSKIAVGSSAMIVAGTLFQLLKTYFDETVKGQLYACPYGGVQMSLVYLNKTVLWEVTDFPENSSNT